jgi:hypothetical protein
LGYAGHHDAVTGLQSFHDFDSVAGHNSDFYWPRSHRLIWPNDPSDRSPARWRHEGRNRNQQSVPENAGPAKSHRDGGGHAGQDLNVLWRLHRGADTERLRRRISFLSDFPYGHGKLHAWGSADLGDHLQDIRCANVSYHDGLWYVDGNFEFLDILKPDYRFHGANILPLLDQSLGDDAIVWGAQRAIIQLEFRFDHTPFESAHLASPRLDVFFPTHGPNFEFLASGQFFLLGHPVGGLRSIRLDAGERSGLRKTRRAFGLGPRINKSGFRRAQVRFPTSLLLWTLAGFQGTEDRA